MGGVCRAAGRLLGRSRRAGDAAARAAARRAARRRRQLEDDIEQLEEQIGDLASSPDLSDNTNRLIRALEDLLEQYRRELGQLRSTAADISRIQNAYEGGFRQMEGVLASLEAASPAFAQLSFDKAGAQILDIIQNSEMAGADHDVDPCPDTGWTSIDDGDFLPADVVDALLKFELEDEHAALLRSAIASLNAPDARIDGKDLIRAFDQISYAALKRTNTEYYTVPAALLFRSTIDKLFVKSPPAAMRSGSWIGETARWAFLEWWYDAWLAHLGRDQIRSYIQSPFHHPQVEDRVRSVTANQITVYHDSAKEKLIEKLGEVKARTRADAARLRAQGQDTDRLDQQVTAYEWAIDVIEDSLK